MISSAIILAAGKGEKMWPYGETRAKACLPVGNVPIIVHQLRCLKEIGVTEFTIVNGYLGQQVRGAVLKEGVQARFLSQENPEGTAAALNQALEEQEADAAFVLYGDVVATKESYQALLDSWAPDKDAAALVHKMERGEDSGEWICASAGDDRLHAVHSHSRGHYSHRLCGISILSEKAMGYSKGHPGLTTKLDVGSMPSLEPEVSQTLQDMVSGGEVVGATETQDLFVDVDKPWHLLEANGRMAEYRNSGLAKDEIAEGAEISKDAEIHGSIRIGPNSHIGKRVVIQGNVTIGANTSITNGAMVGRSIIIGDDTKIRDYCQLGTHSVVGDNCVIGHCAEFGGTLMNKVYLYHYCELSGIIGTATDIGAATVCGTLRFDDGRTAHVVKGRREYPQIGSNETYIGEYCRTGVNAIIMPGVKVGPYSILGPGTVVYDDVPARTLLLVKQEQITKEWGPEKYGW